MFKYFILCGYIFLNVCLLNAQTAADLKVVNDAGQPLTGVSVSILRSDSSLAKLSITKSNGIFTLPPSTENYILKLSMVGYQTAFYTITADQKTGGPFVLKRDEKTLNNVTVQTKIPLYQFQADKTIMNVDAAPSNAGNSLLELLSKIPDVYIDKDGNITLNGKPGVLVMIDGRETFLSGNDLVNMLRGMPASTAHQVEIVSNPSSKYDATATGGILNIKTKKSLYEGWNGNFSTSSGVTVIKDIDGKNKFGPLHNSTVNWNYRKRKVNFYGNASYDRGYYFENFKTLRNYYEVNTKDPQGSYFSWSHIKTPGNFFQLRTAMDVTLNSKNLLGFIFTNSYGTNTSKGATNSYVMDNEERIDYLMRSTIENPGGHDFNGNYNINHKYTGKKWELSSDVSLLKYYSISKTFNETYFTDASGNTVIEPLFRRQTSENRFTGAVAKTDLIINDWLKAKWEAGYKYSFIETINDPLFLRKEGSEFVIDGGRTNHLTYSDRIHAAYAMGTRTLKNTTLQAGLRMEQVRSKGYQRINDSAFTRNWLDFFPSIYLKQQFTKNYQLIVNYSRKIRRPSAGNLNPFTYFTDSLYSNSGNPFLQPQFSHNFELRNIVKNKYAVTLIYTLVNDAIMMVVRHDPVQKTIQVRQYNFDQYQTATLNATIPITITKRWSSNISITAGANEARGFALGQSIKESSEYISFNVSSNFTLSPSLFADVNINYTTPQLNGLIEVTRPLLYSIGVRKNFKNNKGGITLSANTPFYIPHFEFDAEYANTKYHSRFSNANQNFKLSLNLRFGKQTVTQQRNKKNATEEEQSRM